MRLLICSFLCIYYIIRFENCQALFLFFFVAPMGDCFLFSFILCIYYNIRIFICQYFFKIFGIVFSANCFPFLYLIIYYIIIFYKKQVVILHKFWDKNLCNFLQILLDKICGMWYNGNFAAARLSAARQKGRRFLPPPRSFLIPFF